VPPDLNKKPYVYTLPTSVSFTGKGLLGYTFGPLKQDDLEIYYVEVEKGHDVFMVSKKITRTYYILEGNGYFTIDGCEYQVAPGMLVEVPPKVEYCYSGKMKLLALSKPRWFSGNDTFTKWNPDVVGSELAWTNDDARLRRLLRLRFFGRSPVTAFRGVNQWLWGKIPSFVTRLGLVRAYGNFLHSLARLQEARGQAFSTFFLRNRPQLELIRRVIDQKSKGETVRVAVLACSTGAEAYSVAWTIRSARPDLRLILSAVDISKQAVEFAERGIYSINDSQLSPTEIFSRMRKDEVESMFDKEEGESLAVKSWLKQGINWSVGDAAEPGTIEALGPQDIVVANNFICHMDERDAERCLRNIARLVRPYGHLFVSGVDLDVRTGVARDLGWLPSEELIDEIHEGDPCMRSYWPGHYAGLEPLDKKRSDWRIRYAAAFQLLPTPATASPSPEKEPATA